MAESVTRPVAEASDVVARQVTTAPERRARVRDMVGTALLGAAVVALAATLRRWWPSRSRSSS